MRVKLALLFVIVAMFGGSAILGQSPNASISGVVLDPDKKSIAEAEILVVNDYTRVQYEAKTNTEGFFSVTNLPPGQYRLQVSKFGFKAIIKPDIILNVQESLAINFTLPIGASSVVVTVEGGAPLINTTDGTVSTVVDRNFVENMPLNGRSFQDLILLAPGVVTTNPQTASNPGSNGEFSVNGQRSAENYYTVDGVSGNTGVVTGLGFNSQGYGGSLPSSTALGTTQSLVSVDALEEFRIQTSTYSAEFGRSPGGQFALVTRSGTNQLHGTVFEYLRNNVFDAHDWFTDYYDQPGSALRQNDFGATLGGPIVLPGLYDGRKRSFFFLSYEGLRLVQPQPASVAYVPDLALRQSAPGALQPVLNNFPLPNCASAMVNCTNLSNGLAGFVGSWSNPSSIDTGSVRLDHTLNQKAKLFARFSDTPSSARTVNTGNPGTYSYQRYVTRSYTAGLTSLFQGHLENDLRGNYSTNQAEGGMATQSFAGGEAVDLASLQGVNRNTNPNYAVAAEFFLSNTSSSVGELPVAGLQRQLNIIDTLGLVVGRHRLSFGVDYRRSAPIQRPINPSVIYSFFDKASVLQNTPLVYGSALTRAYPVYTNVSGFIEDEWKVNARLNLSLGLRWEWNPAPGARKRNLPYTLDGTDPNTVQLAPEGTPLWQTTWHNFAPRLGAAYLVRATPGFETVVRGGFGLFYDTGQQLGSQGYFGVGFSSSHFVFAGLSFPAPLSEAVLPIVNPPTVPYDAVIYAFDPHLQLPLTLEWNATVEQGLGKSQALSVSYVGANGRRLLEEQQIAPPANPTITDYVQFRNGLTSNYEALQIRFQRKLTGGLAALASYTFAHAIDYGSQNYLLPYVRGNSDFDVRHNFSAAAAYEFPAVFHRRVGRALLDHWAVDDRLTVRTAFPVTLEGQPFIDPVTGKTLNQGLDLVPGQSIYLYGPQYPDGRAINPNAFAFAPANQIGTAPRNFVRGFGTWQMDLALRRDFLIRESWKLQFRAEAFNIFNHPNMGTIDATLGDPLFGQATATLSQSLGTLNPLYQMGGPRSLQFALKCVF